MHVPLEYALWYWYGHAFVEWQCLYNMPLLYASGMAVPSAIDSAFMK